MEWIPVSESLPAEGYTVLVTVWEDMSYGKNTDIRRYVDLGYFIKDDYIAIPVDEKAAKEGSFMIVNDWDEGQPCKVTAWMPLPRPYKEEQK